MTQDSRRLGRWRVEYADAGTGAIGGRSSTWYDCNTAREAGEMARRDGLHSILSIVLAAPPGAKSQIKTLKGNEDDES